MNDNQPSFTAHNHAVTVGGNVERDLINAHIEGGIHLPGLSARQLISSATSRSAQALGVGGFPFLLIWIVQRSQLAMQNLVHNSAVVGGIFRAVVVAFAAVNPSRKDEFRSLKDIIAFLRFVKAKS